MRHSLVRARAALHYPGALYQVMRDDRLSDPQLEQRVYERLRSVLTNAYLHVPYYREQMNAARYNPLLDYSGPDDLSVLPATPKSVIRARGTGGFVQEGRDLSHCFNYRTSGSTGMPFRVYRDSGERALHTAKWLRVLFVNGYSVRHSVMSITPSLPGEGRSVVQRFGILRRLAADYTRSPERLVDALLDFEPDILYGYRSHLDLMAMELKRRGVRPKGLKLLVATAEVIPQSSRGLHRRYFGLETVESYGSTEMGVMAYETPERDGMHICEDLALVELLDQDGQSVPSGTPGRVVVTDLMAKVMPFIRYDQGDLAVYGHAGDGLGIRSRRLLRILGREDDYAVLPDGTRRTRYDFAPLINHFDGVLQYRVVQRTLTDFEIQLVAERQYVDSICADMLHRFRNAFPPGLDFVIVHRDRLEPDPGGKLRVLISEVEP